MEVTPKHEYSSPCCPEESSPSRLREEKSHPKLSASLRERLKRSRRSFVSPVSVAKRLCVDDAEDEGPHMSPDSKEAIRQPAEITPSVDDDRRDVQSGSERSPEAFLQHLRKEVKEKTETLRRLKMVKMYRSKNDLTQLQTLIDKWRCCSQNALYELQSDVTVDGRRANLSELIDLFGLDDHFLHFDRSEEDFTT
ncbi:swi5-dependent recombination DNA repair protein 1 homolog isoform X2 [Oryzias melastigma]|uniref:Swi5-dependent recombination DNA repair protein 1 homolog n=1 Tax=Oryzias melastigma TaxID=30732 RepID=A0A3B3BIW0_ORYME|nr:swi5-dependent recombination DNA repair protein 1 homolog isoform X2 [Oryzias melastigma]